MIIPSLNYSNELWFFEKENPQKKNPQKEKILIKVISPSCSKKLQKKIPRKLIKVTSCSS
jgi:hypothetical protein